MGGRRAGKVKLKGRQITMPYQPQKEKLLGHPQDDGADILYQARPPKIMIKRVISGGQTGADRAGLDAAIATGIPHGGSCPKGRRAEDGQIPGKYALQETDSPDYRVRTEQNVKASDGTVVFTFGKPTGGSALTIKLAEKHQKPVLHIDLSDNSTESLPSKIRDWISKNKIHVLNVAGSRESKSPDIHDAVMGVMKPILIGEDK